MKFLLITLTCLSLTATAVTAMNKGDLINKVQEGAGRSGK